MAERSDIALSLYLKDLDRVPPLTREHEQEVARKALAGDTEAREKLVQSNLRFVVHEAKRYAGRKLPLIDLISEGNIGLLHAAERFDPDEGVRFISYAVYWIRQAMRKALHEKSRMIRIPVRQVSKLAQLDEARRELSVNGVTPGAEDIADHLHMSREQLAALQQMPIEPAALDAPVSAEQSTAMWETIEDPHTCNKPESEIDGAALRDSLHRVLQMLSERESNILILRYGMNGGAPLSLKEVAVRFGISPERARQLEKKALHKLRRLAASYLQGYGEAPTTDVRRRFEPRPQVPVPPAPAPPAAPSWLQRPDPSAVPPPPPRPAPLGGGANTHPPFTPRPPAFGR